MKISKKTLSIILFVLAGICVLAAVILLVKGRIEDRRMEEALDELRPTQSAETTQAPSTVEGEPTVTVFPEPSTEETPASTEYLYSGYRKTGDFHEGQKGGGFLRGAKCVPYSG